MEHELSKAAQIERLLDIGLRLHQQGSLGEAEEVYREILRADFQYSDAWHLLGVLALKADFAQAAIELISEAVTLDPEQPIFRKDLGNAYRRLCLLYTSDAADESRGDVLGRRGTLTHNT